MANQASSLTVAEYFAGIGLVRMGLESVGWQVVFANDISAKKFAMYRGFFPSADNHYIVRDVFKLKRGDIPDTILSTCSFPCIDVSLAGNMRGMSGTHSKAFWGFVKCIERQGANSPSIVLLENVPGWLYSNAGKDFRVTIQAINKLGYSCDVFMVNAQSFTPQSRPRIFLVGIKQRAVGCPSEKIRARPVSLMPGSLNRSIAVNRDLHWTYLPIPEPPPRLARGLSDIIESIPHNDPRWWPATEVDRHLHMMSDRHKNRIDLLVRHGVIAYRTFYRRIRGENQRAEVRDDEIAGCLRTAVGGSGKQFLIKITSERIMMRQMTAREYARLQGVPDSYPIAADGVQALTGFGDAVCVPVISWIARNILNPLAESLIR